MSLLLPLIPLAYLIGSIPFGLIVALSRGIDPRTAGSKNIGATNVGRLLGGKFFAIVFTLDLLKGLIPTAAAGAIVHATHQNSTSVDYLLWLLAAAAAIFGHMFSLFLRFKGGKGVATSAGVLLGIFPYYTLPGLIAIGIWCLIFFITRYVSLASILGSAAFPLIYVAVGAALGWPLLSAQLPLLLFALLIPTMILIKHRSNIARLRAGTENRFVRNER